MQVNIVLVPDMVQLDATGPFEEWHRYAWAAALVLILVVFVLSVGARLAIRRRFSLNG